MNVMRLSVLAMIAAATVVQIAEAEDPASPDGSRRINDIPYAEVDGQQLLLDLYLPKEAHRPSLVVWIHGGAWRSGSKSNMPLTDLVKNGFAVASVD